MQVNYEGKQYTFPDDATDAEILDFFNSVTKPVTDRETLISQIPGATPEAIAQSKIPYVEPSMGQKAIGAGEAVLSTATGATGGMFGSFVGTIQGLVNAAREGKLTAPEAEKIVQQKAQEYASSLTYAPRTEKGQDYTKVVSNALSNLAAIAPMAGQPALTPRVGPAGVAIEQNIRAIPQELSNLKQAVTADNRVGVGAAATPETLRRTTIAENLPVPVELTKGAASREAGQLAFEKEMMKQDKLGVPLRARAEANNLQLLQNFDELIDRTGTTVSDPISVGGSVVSALTKGWKEAKNKTRVAYSEAKKSPGANDKVDPFKPVTVSIGDEPVSTSLIEYVNSQPTGVPATALIDSVRAYTKKLKIADVDADGMLTPKETTVKNMEELRKAINESSDLNQPQAKILKDIIDAQMEGLGGEMYKRARAFRTEQARKYENRAVVARLLNKKGRGDDPRVAADQVFDRTILGGSPEEITFIKRVLQTNGAEGVKAWNDLQGATVRYIRDRASAGAGMDSAGRPIISADKLNKALTTLDENGRLGVIFDKKTAQILRDINEISKAINTVPPGTLINSSGTAGTLIAAISEAGITGTLAGLPVPVLSSLRLAAKGITNLKTRRRIENALAKYEQKAPE